jgi:hypothetical protein
MEGRSRGLIGVLSYIRFEGLRKTTDRITGIMADIPTEHIPNTESLMSRPACFVFLV